MSAKCPLVIVLTVLASASAHAEEQFNYGGVKIDVVVSSTFTSCIDAAGGGDFPMMACITAEVALWDQRLNAAYAKLRARLPKSDFAALQAQQRLWIGYRDAACRDNGQDGTAGRVAADDCALRLTAVRTAELEMRAAGPN